MGINVIEVVMSWVMVMFDYGNIMGISRNTYYIHYVMGIYQLVKKMYGNISSMGISSTLGLLGCNGNIVCDIYIYIEQPPIVDRKVGHLEI